MEGGGWKPIIRRRPLGYHQIHQSGPGLFTVFVDNLLEFIVPKSLFILFSNYGMVRDVFIPMKTRETTGSRFGFIRYDCQVAARVVVQKAEGLWCDDKVLSVRIFVFGNEV
ncbi:hypothetical protein ACSBR1_039959 [Camellia fascicularis]